jgi:hypothetical protein
MLLDGALFTDRQLVLDESGVYTATVSGATPTTIGTYSFQLVRVPVGDEFVISFGDTVSDGVPGPGAGNIEAPGARDVYAFDGVVGESVIFDLLAGSNVALGWELAAPYGSVLFDSFLGDRQLVLPATGVYSLSVRGNNPDDTGTYSFQLLESPPNSPPEIAPIADQTNTEGDDVTIPISAGDPDGDPLTITATGLPPGITVDVDRLAGTLIVGSARTSRPPRAPESALR